MRWMFHSATSFDQALDKWDVSKVTDMSMMFYNAISFGQSLNKWNVSNVKSYQSIAKNTSLSCKKLPKQFRDEVSKCKK